MEAGLAMKISPETADDAFSLASALLPTRDTIEKVGAQSSKRLYLAQVNT
jgi:hypothetical protein